MPERSAKIPNVRLEFEFDRLLSSKLQQVYGLLVADCVRPVGQVSHTDHRGDGDEACSDLRESLLSQTEGGARNCESNGGAARLRPAARVQRSR